MFGKYYCEAKNDLGRSRSYISLSGRKIFGFGMGAFTGLLDNSGYDKVHVKLKVIDGWLL